MHRSVHRAAVPTMIANIQTLRCLPHAHRPPLRIALYVDASLVRKFRPRFRQLRKAVPDKVNGSVIFGLCQWELLHARRGMSLRCLTARFTGGEPAMGAPCGGGDSSAS